MEEGRLHAVTEVTSVQFAMTSEYKLCHRLTQNVLKLYSSRPHAKTVFEFYLLNQRDLRAIILYLPPSSEIGHRSPVILKLRIHCLLHPVLLGKLSGFVFQEQAWY